ncbi:hypothetical protein CISG_10208 [Coccidioides immitis RMSCC 3703]|uniref:Uncharacterized protein n=1 Tax=Coccidioides immitis RMSCC 3703 TaxID=454286 RepID=A0A0J8QQX5_COCIT|nr:hypothetical protein CISG_10208 [Coccidioides immitis RMSCC 3703]
MAFFFPAGSLANCKWLISNNKTHQWHQLFNFWNANLISNVQPFPEDLIILENDTPLRNNELVQTDHIQLTHQNHPKQALKQKPAGAGRESLTSMPQRVLNSLL